MLPTATDLRQDFTKFVKVHINDRKVVLPKDALKSKHETGGFFFLPTITEFVKSNLPANYTPKKGDVNFGLAGALWTAYNTHTDVIITPDDFWLTVLLGFSAHVNANAEKLRPYFVSHEGKKDLEVTVEKNPQVEKNWDEVADLFQKALNGAVKADTAKILECDFSTSGPMEKVVSNIASMSVFQKYFNYICYTLCGIRNLYFAGTLDDWML